MRRRETRNADERISETIGDAENWPLCESQRRTFARGTKRAQELKVDAEYLDILSVAGDG